MDLSPSNELEKDPLIVEIGKWISLNITRLPDGRLPQEAKEKSETAIGGR